MQISEETQRLARIEKVLGTFIVWTAQSINSPIRRDEAEELLQMLHGGQDANK
jgi:hypothetical protein